MQELISASDMLITDYSSSIWDFSLTQKPCILYTPDLSFYSHKDRGFFVPIERWPGKLCCNEEDLIETIENLNMDDCRKIAIRHQMEMVSYEYGNACEQVANYIHSFIDCAEAHPKH